jgi:2-iminobutanoate/2-iminopropanoate deaminase
MPACVREASTAVRSSTPAREVDDDVTHHRQTVNAPGAPAAIGSYNHAVRSGDLLFCSGQIPLDPETGEIVGDTPAEQTRQCLRNLDAIARAGGASLADAVRIGVFLVDIGAFAEVNEAYAEFFAEDDAPARYAVGVASLPRGALVGFEAVVAVP